MVRYLGERAKREGLANVVAVQGGPKSPNLPVAVDLVLLVDVYHHIDDRVAYFRACARVPEAGRPGRGDRLPPRVEARTASQARRVGGRGRDAPRGLRAGRDARVPARPVLHRVRARSHEPPILLASRPKGEPNGGDLPHRGRAAARARRRRGAGEEPLAVARSVHARSRLATSKSYAQARRDRRRDGRPDRRRGGRVARRGLQAGRQGAHLARLAAVRRRAGAALRKVDDRRVPLIVLPRRARHAGHHRVVRPARDRPAEAGRDGRRIGGVGRGRQRRRADREEHGLPRGRHRRRPGEVRATCATSSASTPASTIAPDGSTRTSPRPVPTASTSTSRTSAATVLDTVLRLMNPFSRVVAVRPDQRLQRHRAVRH